MAEVQQAPDSEGIVICRCGAEQLRAHSSVLRPGWHILDSDVNSHKEVFKKLVAASAAKQVTDDVPVPTSVMGLPIPQSGMFVQQHEEEVVLVRT
jgi:hypothetical protein